MSRGLDRDDVEDLYWRGGSSTPQADERASRKSHDREESKDSRRTDSRSESIGRGASSARRQTRTRNAGARHRERPALGNRRTALACGSKSYRLRETELRSLEEIGRFRAVTEQDLSTYRYSGDSNRMGQDLRSLARQGLAERRQVTIGNDGERTPAVTLTPDGKQLVEQQSTLGNENRQEFHAGFVKPSELAHDLALYRVYQAERERIEAAGGAVDRVVLDYEIKRDVYSALSGQDVLDDERFAELQQQVAEHHNLQVVDGKIPLPDLRIEYHDASGASARVDVELTTQHYKSGQIATKAEAGFSLYALGGDGSSGGAPVRDERDITAGVLSV